MGQLTVSIAFFIALFAGLHDLFTRRIPNWLTFPAMGLGIGVQSYLLGWQGLQNAGLGLLLGFALYFPFFAAGQFGFKVFGAGDVKLLMALGAWTDWRQCLTIGLLSILVAAVYAIIDVTRAGRLFAFCRALYRFFLSVFIKGFDVEWPALDGKRTFSYGLAMTVATGISIYLEQVGKTLW